VSRPGRRRGRSRPPLQVGWRPWCLPGGSRAPGTAGSATQGFLGHSLGTDRRLHRQATNSDSFQWRSSRDRLAAAQIRAAAKARPPSVRQTRSRPRQAV